MNCPPAEQCAICSQQPQDMLVLSCSHNLCLDCATQLFGASPHSPLIQCQICLETTPLDQETINCLSDLALKQKYTTPHLNLPRVPKPYHDSIKFQCLEHKEKSLYFCFDCQNGSICSECIVDAKHSGHKIMTIKKANIFLKEKVEENSNYLEDLKLKIKEYQAYIKETKEKMISEYQQKDANLRCFFQSIMRQIESKYGQLKGELENMMRRSNEILQGTLNILIQKIECFNNSICQNRKALQKQSDESILGRYIQIQLKKDIYQLDIPQINFSQLLQKITLVQDSALNKDMMMMLGKIKWNKVDNQNCKENRADFIKIEPSFLNSSFQQVKYSRGINIGQYQQVDRSIQENSVGKYSGIKGSSRRLQMSRSMDNATNIINKLQQRIKR